MPPPSAPAPTPAPDLPARALDTTPENPWPLRLLSSKIEDYVSRMSPLWVEGQVVELNRRPGAGLQFMTLRDTDADMSLTVAMSTHVLAGHGDDVAPGAHVVVHAKPSFWPRRGTLQLQAREIRAVGLGELLARIEHLRRVLAAEGLFDHDRKKPLPFLPGTVGLVCGRESKAEHDVVVNARERWPQVRFEIREVAVQGPSAVPQVSAAIAELDARPDVDVIVVARGGGAVEDLLPFSNETLVRAAAECRTPLVSAIGHETDAPLLDLVADYRASTPTDAARRIVPDVREERRGVTLARERLRSAVRARVDREQAGLDAFRSRPVLADPVTMIDRHEELVAHHLRMARRAFDDRVTAASAQVDRLAAQVRALSPAATLARGYAVVHGPDGHVVRRPDEVSVDDRLRLRLADGELTATVTAPAPGTAPPPIQKSKDRTTRTKGTRP